jgi:hypothetical protein
MDAISMLKADHKTVEQLFKRFERAGPRAHAEKRDVVDPCISGTQVGPSGGAGQPLLRHDQVGSGRLRT